jgi:hypothetical protein
MDYQKIRGFNYQPSYGTTGLELWLNFDEKIIELELGRGKKHFPWMNAIRLWLSWDAFRRNEKQFAINFETALVIADRHGLKVMPVLFNRWHTKSLDYGGIYIDHFLPGSRIQGAGVFDAYIEKIVGGHANDARIFSWDLCNEPFFYADEKWETPELLKSVAEAELKWLEKLYFDCKKLKAIAPITVGVTTSVFEQVVQISDILSFHPYYNPKWSSLNDFEKMLDAYVERAAKHRKPLIATETCWGSYDDQERAGIICFTLAALNERGIGWLAYLLQTSGIADAHGLDEGPVSEAGNLAFILPNGELRPGHHVIHEFGEK